MLNKNICIEVWRYYLNQITDNHRLDFKKTFYTSYYRKGDYISNEINGIYTEGEKILFSTVVGKSLSWDKVSFHQISDITEYIFPNINSKKVSDLEYTIVNLRRLQSDLDLCYNKQVGDEYISFLNTTNTRIDKEINNCIKIVIDCAISKVLEDDN